MSEFVEKWEFFVDGKPNPIPEFWQEMLETRHMILGLAVAPTGGTSSVTVAMKFGYGWDRGRNQASYTVIGQYLLFRQFMCLIHIVEQDDNEVGTPRPEAQKEDEDVGARQSGDAAPHSETRWVTCPTCKAVDPCGRMR